MNEDHPSALVPVIDPSVRALRPDFRCVSLNVTGYSWEGADAATVAGFIERAEQNAGAEDAERTAHLEAWREAYRAFGAKPKRTPCSAEALLRRTARDGALPRINPLVDVYNAVSIAHGLPIGGEDRVLYEGNPQLTRAAGDEPFEAMKDGAVQIEHPDAGEVIWADEKGVTCRRWNWRQGVRTRILPGASHLWFVLETLEGLSETRLAEAADQMAELIQALSPNAKIDVSRLLG